jgi:hypothetical protein
VQHSWTASGALERAWAALVHAYDAEIGLAWSWLAADERIVKASFGQQGGPVRRKPPGATRPIGENLAPNATC